MWARSSRRSAPGSPSGCSTGNRRQGVDLATSLYGQLAPALGDIDIKVQGGEHLWSHRPAVFLVNHQSSVMDMVVAFRLLEREFTFVAKAEIAKVPVFGQLFSLADVIFVDRSNTTKAVEALAPGVEKLRNGISVIFAPEGTRSVTPTIGRFKKGAFRMAMEAGVPVVPIVLRNSGELMWRDSQIARVRDGRGGGAPADPTSSTGRSTNSTSGSRRSATCTSRPSKDWPDPGPAGEI